MIEFRAFRPGDIAEIQLQAAQVAAADAWPQWRAQAAQAGTLGPAWTGALAGRVLGCAGMVEQWPGRAEAWCMIGCDVPRWAWLAIHRTVAWRMDVAAEALGFRRIEATVRAGWAPGERWVRMLGFEYEGLMRAYSPDGADYVRWARVR